MVKLNGGSVYPHEEHFDVDGKRRPVSIGMTLRDRFAESAMKKLIGTERGVHWGPAEYAKCAYSMADAMIAERAK